MNRGVIVKDTPIVNIVNNSIVITLMVDRDTSYTRSYKLLGRTITINRKKYDLSHFEKNQDEINRVRHDSDLNIDIRVNDFTHYNSQILLKGDIPVRISITKLFQIKHIQNPDDKPSLSPFDSTINVADPRSCHRHIEYPPLTATWFSNVKPDTTHKGNLIFEFYRSTDDRLSVDSAALSPEDSTGEYTKIIQRQKIGDPMLYYISIPYRAWDIGAISTPIKLVLDAAVAKYGNDLSNLNLGVYVAREFGHTRFYYNSSNNFNTISFIPALFFSTTILSLTTVNSNVPAPPLAIVAESALGVSYGVAVQIGVRNINFGLISGFDTPISPGYDYKWAFTNKPWIGLSLSYNIGLFAPGH